MTLAIPCISMSHIRDVEDQVENLKYQAIIRMTISVAQNMRILFNAG